jgi:hypothetical protein
MRHPLLIAVLALAVDSAGAGDVFKCTDASGQVSFTDRPCPKGSETEALRLRGGGMVGGESAESRARRRACAELARPAWDLLPREASGQLGDAETALLRDTRAALATQCRQRLTASALAFECREQLAALTRATAAASDPRRERDRDRVQAEFDRRCGEAAVLDDIARHLRELQPGAGASAPPGG